MLSMNEAGDIQITFSKTVMSPVGDAEISRG